MRFIIFLLCLSTQILHAQIDLSEIKSLIQNEVEQNHFSGNILIADQGTAIYQASFGNTTLDKQIPIQTDTRFSVASITKMMTAILTLQLVEEGQLSLEDNLSGLLPEFEIPKAKKISIHHLLLHISGLPNEHHLIYRKPVSPVEYVNATLNNKNKGAGFGSFNYNNLDYVLLGLIIEKKTGKSWQENIQSKIINPLGLTQTGFLEKDKYPADFAYSYRVMKDGELESDPSFYIENFYAAACMFSTVNDLLKLDQAMYGELLLSEASKKKMFTSYPEYNYTGYSVWTYQYPFAKSQPQIMERRGGILGANCAFIRILDQNKTIIILSNNDQFNPDSFGDPTNLREALIKVVSVKEEMSANKN